MLVGAIVSFMDEVTNLRIPCFFYFRCWWVSH